MNRSLLSHARSWAVRAAACVALMSAAGGAALAQEIEPNEFVPAPAGTNLAIGYYIYADNDQFNVAGGSTVKKANLQVNVGILRLVHFIDLDGHPAGFQILEAFGNESGGNIGGARLGSATGASNLDLSAFYWFIADTANKQYLNTAIFLYPPVGTYDKYNALNLNSAFGEGSGYNWTGDWQVGWDNGIGDNFSYDLAFDLSQSSDYNTPAGRNSRDTGFRLQAWANWNWTRAFQTSIGWESMLGGAQQTNGFNNGNKGEFERLRVASGLFVAPNAQVLLELNHDFVNVGGFRQVFGATGRFVYVF